MFARKKEIQSAGTGKAGDICFYSLVEGRKIIVPFEDYDYSLYPIEEYYPLGVVVVPTSHDVYGTGECGVISLNWMSSSTPQNGGGYEEILWGYHSGKIFDYDGAPLLPDLTTNTFESYKYYIGVGLIPYQGGQLLPTGDNMDKDAGYQIVSGRDWYIPSPYLDDDAKNNAFHQATFTADNVTYRNVLSDYNGKVHTTSFIGNANINSYPAIKACSQYSPLGTNQGEWYLPTIGELCYIMPKWNVINNTLNVLNQDYNIGYVVDNCWLWSVNGYSGNEYSKFQLVVNYGSEKGLCTYTHLDKYRAVRSFMRVK